MPEKLPHIRIFPLVTTKGDFRKGDLQYTIYWIMKLGNEPYNFRKKTPKDFPKGSIAVFDFEGKIFGQAITSVDVKKYSPKEQEENEGFTGEVKFEQSSIDIFSKYLPISEVRKIIGKECIQTFPKLNWIRYQEILKAVGRIPKKTSPDN